MGLNDKHNKNFDLAEGRNLTQNSVFKFELITNQSEKRKYEAMMGITFDKQVDMIKINGRSEINDGDKIEIFGMQRIVQSHKINIDSKYDLAFKNYLDDSYGDTLVVLE